MNDQTQPTPIDMLVNRLATRVGQLTAENEWMAVQLEQANTELAALREQHASTNGETHEVVTP